MTWFIVITTTVATIGVIGSLLFSGWQSRELARQTRELSRQTMAQRNHAHAVDDREPLTMLHSMLSVLVERPELRRYFYDGTPTDRLGHTDRARLESLAEIVADTIHCGLNAVESHALDAESSIQAQSWVDYATASLASSPILREIVDRYPTWWPHLTTLRWSSLDQRPEPGSRAVPPTSLVQRTMARIRNDFPARPPRGASLPRGHAVSHRQSTRRGHATVLTRRHPSGGIEVYHDAGHPITIPSGTWTRVVAGRRSPDIQAVR